MRASLDCWYRCIPQQYGVHYKHWQEVCTGLTAQQFGSMMFLSLVLYFSPLRLPTPPPPPPAATGGRVHELVTMMKVTTARQTTASHAQHELDLYVVAPAIARDQFPLCWWAANVTSYPLVAKVARRLLAIPAT